MCRHGHGTHDLLLHYHASTQRRLTVSDYCQTDECRSYTGEYEAGTLIVDILDARTQRLAWRGWGESDFDGVVDNQDWMDGRIDRIVTKILQRLPQSGE